MAPAVREPVLGYHPCSTGFLTCARDPGGGQCQAGSLTGAVASERVSEALKASLALTSPLNLPAPGRRQPIYFTFRFRIDLCFC